MDISLSLARLMGPFLLILSSSLLINRKQALSWMREGVKNRVLIILSGVMALVVGELIVSVHSLWVNDWRVIVTLIGWLLVLKGVVRILFPQHFASWVGRFTGRGLLIGSLVALAIGIVLTVNGYGLLAS